MTQYFSSEIDDESYEDLVTESHPLSNPNEDMETDSLPFEPLRTRDADEFPYNEFSPEHNPDETRVDRNIHYKPQPGNVPSKSLKEFVERRTDNPSFAKNQGIDDFEEEEYPLSEGSGSPNLSERSEHKEKRGRKPGMKFSQTVEPLTFHETILRKRDFDNPTEFAKYYFEHPKEFEGKPVNFLNKFYVIPDYKITTQKTFRRSNFPIALLMKQASKLKLGKNRGPCLIELNELIKPNFNRIEAEVITPSRGVRNQTNETRSKIKSELMDELKGFCSNLVSQALDSSVLNERTPRTDEEPTPIEELMDEIKTQKELTNALMDVLPEKIKEQIVIINERFDKNETIANTFREEFEQKMETYDEVIGKITETLTKMEKFLVSLSPKTSSTPRTTEQVYSQNSHVTKQIGRPGYRMRE